MHDSSRQPDYLVPYLRAAERYGGGFGSLLWASRRTQAARFEAIAEVTDFAGRTVLDAGCGRADLLAYLVSHGIVPAHYVGIEAVSALADAAEGVLCRHGVGGLIVRADFVREPARLFAGAERVVISGALNTLDDAAFYATLRRAYDASAEVLTFNFLCSPLLAGKPFLYWRRTSEVLAFARALSSDVRVLDAYLEGDCTVSLRKRAEPSQRIMIADQEEQR